MNGNEFQKKLDLIKNNTTERIKLLYDIEKQSIENLCNDFINSIDLPKVGDIYKSKRGGKYLIEKTWVSIPEKIIFITGCEVTEITNKIKSNGKMLRECLYFYEIK